MRRIVGLVVIRQVAVLAGTGGQIVVVVDVARGAGHVCVPIRQRKASGTVIESGRRPIDGVVASGAISSGKNRTGGRVRRIVGLVVLRHVAVLAGAGAQVVVVIDVASGAGNVCVPIREWEARRTVIEDHTRPAGGVVALRAVCRCERRSGARVTRIIRLLPCRQVALGIAAVRRLNLQIVVVVDVALRAGHVGVARGQRETRGAVIKLGIQPAVEIVATLAVRGGKRRTSRGMRRVRRVLPVFQVARVTLR